MAYQGLGGSSGGAIVGTPLSTNSGVSLGDILKSPLTFTGNLAKDIGSAAIGLPAGLQQMVDNPIGAAEAIGQSFADTWGPLVTGHPGTFLKEFYEHPLAPILDVAAIFTLGAGSAGRVARGLESAGAAGEGGKVARLASYSREGSKTLYRKDVPGRAGRSKAFDAVPRQDIPFQTPNTVSGKLRAEFFHNLAESLATRGGHYGRLTQLPYEMSYTGRLSGNISAMATILGMFSDTVNKFWDTEKGIAKTNSMRGYAKTYHGNVVNKAIETNRVLSWEGPKSDWKGQVYNLQAYGLVGKRSRLWKAKAETNPETGLIEKRALGSGTKEQAERDVAQWGRRIVDDRDPLIVTGKQAEALGLDPKKNHMFLADRYSLANQGKDAYRGTRVLNAFYRGTNIWKMILLGLSPRFFVNNAVGNTMLYMFNEAGPGALFAYREAWRHIGKEKSYLAADKTLGQALKEIQAERWMYKHFADQMGQSLHHSNLPDKVSPETLKGTALYNRGYRPGGKLERVAQHTFGVTGKYAERQLRMATIIHSVARDPRVIKEMERLKKLYPKWSHSKRFNQAADNMLTKHADLRRSTRTHAEDIMGNYSRLSATEDKLRTISPFYTWQRHITRNSFYFAKDRSVRAAFLARLGEYGSEQAIEQLGGEAPDWMRSLVPSGVNIPGGEDSQRLGVIATAGLNPYAQMGDLAQGANALVGGEFRPGETVGSLLNPFLQGAVQEVSGTRLLTGQPLVGKPHGPVSELMNEIGVGRIAVAPFLQLPLPTLAQRSFFPEKYDEPTLYAQSPMESLLGWLGIPLKELNTQRARQLGLAEAQRRERGY